MNITKIHQNANRDSLWMVRLCMIFVFLFIYFSAVSKYLAVSFYQIL